MRGSRRVVSLADDIDADSLTLGDEVFLNNEMTVVIGKAPSGIPRVGETAVFDRYTADGRLGAQVAGRRVDCRRGRRAPSS